MHRRKIILLSSNQNKVKTREILLVECTELADLRLRNTIPLHRRWFLMFWMNGKFRIRLETNNNLDINKIQQDATVCRY